MHSLSSSTALHMFRTSSSTQPGGLIIRILTSLFMQTAMADRCIIAITPSGSVYAFGATADGETFATVTRVQGLLNHKCRQITCGHSATFVLTSNGTLLAWGRCASGLLGTTCRASIFSPKLINFMQPGVSPRELHMRSVSAGMHHAAAVSDGACLLPPLTLQLPSLPAELRPQSGYVSHR